MTAVFTEVLNISIAAGYLILAVIAVRLLFRRIPKSVICLLWMLVGLRLLLPQLPESPFSILPSNQVFTESEVYENLPVIQSGYEELDAAANQYLQEEFMVGANPNSISTYQMAFLWGKLLWIVGMVGPAAYFIYSWLKVRRSVMTAVPEEAEEMKIYRCEGIAEPFLFGMVKPKIYVPWQLSGEELTSVVLHERAHMERGDYILKPTFYMLLILHWFNPLVWAAYILLCRDIEFACDERVMKKLGEEGKKTYSSALLSCSVKRSLLAGCPVAFGEGSVKSRIQRILAYKKPGAWIIGLGTIICIVLVVCFMTGRKEKSSENVIVYEDYEISLTEAVACEETQMIRMQLQIASETASKEEIEAFGNSLDMGAAGFSHGSSGSMIGDTFVKNFSGSFSDDVTSALLAGIMGDDFSYEVVGSFSEGVIQWEDVKKFETDSSMGKVEVVVSPSTLKIQCPEGKPAKRMVYAFVLHMASGEKWRAARVPFILQKEVDMEFDKELYYGFNVQEETTNLDTGESKEGMCWKLILQDEIDPEQIVSVSVEEVSLEK